MTVSASGIESIHEKSSLRFFAVALDALGFCVGQVAR